MKNIGVEIIGISPDTPVSHRKFKLKHDLSVPLASDATLDIAKLYGVWAEKSMYGRKFMGVERSTFLIGDNGHIARIWRKVRVPGHVDDVLEAVRSLAK